LRELCLLHCGVTPPGVASLRGALPGCRIWSRPEELR
jgi:hypothetical protein